MCKNLLRTPGIFCLTVIVKKNAKTKRLKARFDLCQFQSLLLISFVNTVIVSLELDTSSSPSCLGCTINVRC